jgi:hypothetical protein
MKLRMAKADLRNVDEPTFAELAQLADALWDDDKFAAASRIYLQAAEKARRWRLYAHEATALHFAWKALQHASA